MRRTWALVAMGMAACKDGGDTDAPADSDSDAAAPACPASVGTDVLGRSWTWAYNADRQAQGYSGGYTIHVATVEADGDALTITTVADFAYSSPSVTDYVATRTYDVTCDAAGYHMAHYTEDYSYTLADATVQGTLEAVYDDGVDIPADAGAGFHDDVVYTATDSSVGVSNDYEIAVDYVVAGDETVSTPALGDVAASRWDWTDDSGGSGTDWRLDGTGRIKSDSYDLTAYTDSE